MKKIFNIISLVAVAAFTLASCQKEVQQREPSPEETAGCYGVYFPTQAASGSHVYSPVEDPSIDIVLARTNTSGSITVPITAKFSEEVFNVGAATFADGQSETTFTVRFDNAQEGVNYSASFVIEDNQYASMYNSNPVGLDFSVMRVEMKDFLNPVSGKPAIITLNEGWWGEVHQAQMRYYEVDGVRTCTIYSIEEGNGIWGDTQNAELNFTWYTKNNNDAGYNFLEVKKQYFGFDYSDWGSKPESSAVNPIYVYDYPWYWIERGEVWGVNGMGTDWLDEANLTGQIDGSYPVSYYDGNGGFFFNLRYFIPSLSGGFSSDPYEFVAIADGFTRVDYSLELEADYTVEGVTPISVEAGVDVAALRYAIYEGELTATQVANKTEAIISGADPSEIFSDFEYDEEEGKLYAIFGVAPETTGEYTLVGVAYDESANPQTSAAVTFKHIAGSDTEEYAVDLSVFTEATPTRYKDFTEYDSFAFGILGSDITEAHAAIVEASKLSAEFLAELKGDSSYAMPESVIDMINGVGGYYTVATDLDPGTQYAVVVWATNGYEDTIKYDVYTTTAIPENWNPIGTGYYTDDFFTTFFNVDPQTMEVEMAQSEDDPTRFKMIYPYDGKYPYNAEGDWDESKSYDIVFTIPDSKHVYILPQKIGVDWGYGMFSIASMAGRYVAAGYSVDEIEGAGVPFGVLENGIITFPDPDGHSLLISMAGYNAGAWYYANSNDACQIVLPENVSLSSAPVAKKAEKPAGMVTSNLKIASDVQSVFERDPKPVKAQVNVSFERKQNKNNRTVVPAQKDIRK